MNKKILYIGFYSDYLSLVENRSVALAGIDKMEYIIDTLSELNYDVKVLSPAWSKSTQWKYYKGKEIDLRKNVKVKLMPSFSTPNKFMKFIMWQFSLSWLFIQLLINTKKDTKVIVYHSIFYSNIITYAKKIIGFDLILEVEEVYSKVFKTPDFRKRQELNIIKTADYFLFPNNIVPKLLDINKDYVVVHGSYKQQPISKKCVIENNKINIVFAGMVENVRKGAFTSVQVAEFLNEKYLVHILGYGDKGNLTLLTNLIDSINLAKGYQICKYQGVLRGEDYSQFLLSCDIAINPQLSDDTKMKYAFPSKVLSYLSHNLRVISTRLVCIEESEIGNNVHFVNTNSPKEFADKIKGLDTNSSYDSCSLIDKLHLEFKSNLNKLISK